MADTAQLPLIKLDLAFTHALDMPAQGESEPSLDIYLSQSVSCQLARVALLKPSGAAELSITFVATQPGSPAEFAHVNLSMVAKTDVRIASSRQHTTTGAAPVGTSYGGNPAVWKMNSVLSALGSAWLNVDLYMQMRNPEGASCRQPIAVGGVALADLFAPGATEPHKTSIELFIPQLKPGVGLTRDDPRLGRYEHVAGRLQLRSVAMWVGERPVADVVPVWESVKREGRPFDDYVSRCIGKFSRAPQSWRSMTLVNIWSWTARLSVLPVVAYLVSPATATDEQFFANALRIVLLRAKLSVDEVAAWQFADRQTCHRAVCILMNVCSLYGQYCNYILDMVFARDSQLGKRFVLNKDFDWFHAGRLRDSDDGPAIDCEDVSHDFLQLVADLRRVRATTPGVQFLQRVLAHVVPLMLLSGVSSAKIDLSRPDSEVKGHMNFTFLSWTEFLALCDNVPRELHPPAAVLAASRNFPPVCIGEGTGRLDPDGVRPDRCDQSAERRFANGFAHSEEASRVLSGIKPIFCYSSDPKQADNAFYKAFKVMLTNQFLDHGLPHVEDHGIGIWMLRRRDRTTHSLGIEFRDVASAMNERIYGDPYPPVSSTLMYEIKQHLQDVWPMPSLAPPPPPDSEETLPFVAHARANMSRILRLANARRTPSAARLCKTVKCVQYNYVANDRWAALLEQALLAPRPDNTLDHIDAIEEHVTANAGGYLLTLYYREE